MNSSYIPTPQALVNKQAIINIINKDNRSFMYAILSALHPAKRDTERPKQYELHEKLYNWTNIEYPTTINNIGLFEKDNPLISINVFKYENGLITVKLITEEKKHHINLLVLFDGDKKHFTWIKNFSALIAKDHSNHHGKLYPCFLCLHICSSQQVLTKHTEKCKKKSTNNLIIN